MPRDITKSSAIDGAGGQVQCGAMDICCSPLASRLALVVAAVFSAPAALAAVITFGSAADYDNNFYEVAAGSEVAWKPGGFIERTTNGSATTAIYNTGSIGGVSGSGGTAPGAALDKFNNFTVQADVKFTAIDVNNSVGFYTKVDDAGASGYAAIIRLTSATTADFRLFDSSGALATSGIGSQIGSTQFFTQMGAFAANTAYTFKLSVVDVGTTVTFEASLWNTVSGTQIGSTLWETDNTSAVTGLGQVGFRLGNKVQLDNFVVGAAIPEPGSMAMWAAGGVLFFASMARRRR